MNFKSFLASFWAVCLIGLSAYFGFNHEACPCMGFGFLGLFCVFASIDMAKE